MNTSKTERIETAHRVAHYLKYESIRISQLASQSPIGGVRGGPLMALRQNLARITAGQPMQLAPGFGKRVN